MSIAETAAAAEGLPVEFAVNLSAASMTPVTVRWTATTAGGDGTATLEGDGSDLTDDHALTGTVEFAADDTAAKTVRLATVDDDRVEGSETFTVTLSPDVDNPLPDGVTIPTATAAGTGTITEDDMATVSITPEADTQTEGTPFAFEVQLSAAVDEAVNVTWTAVADTAAVQDPNSDLAASQDITGTATFAAGTTTAVAVPIDTLDDDRVEEDEAFTVTLSGTLPTGVDYGTQTATATITDNDSATVSIAETAEAAEGSPVVFAVSLSAASSVPVTVRWTATTTGGDGAATLEGATSDLTASHVLTGTVEFAADDTADKTVSITTADDDRVEGSETFTVTLSPDDDNPLPDGVTIPTATEAGTGTITEDDAAELSITDGAATEGFPVVFEVSLSAAAMEGVTVRWTATTAAPSAGAATLEGTGSDLASGADLTGTVVFRANENAVKTVRLATVDDALVEGDETFTVTLSPDTDTPLPDGVTIPSAGAAATGTITEDETAELSISETATAAEGSSMAFAIDLSAASQNAVTVRWTATTAGGDGAATLSGAGSDLTDGHAVTGTVEFVANDTASKTVSFATVDDTRVEGSETFTVTLSEDTLGGNLLPGGVDISDTLDAGTGTITEDDAAELSIIDGSGAEGSPVVFDVSLSAASSVPVTVRWTATTAGGDGAATLEGAGSDLADGEELTGTVEFAADDTADKTVSLETVDDARVEGDETFTVTLSPDTNTPLPAGVTIPSARAAATGTITEDDMATVSIIPEADTQTEGNPFAFEVQLSAAVDHAVTVTWTAVAGTAAVQDPNSDLAASQDITGTASFAAGTTTAVPVPIATLDDDVVEGEEAFTVTLTGTLPDGVEYGTQTATATLADNDAAELSIETAATAAEGSAVEFAVSLNAASQNAVTVRWTLTATGDRAATLAGAGSDLGTGQDTSGTVEFTANDTADKTVSIATADDARVEGSETFTVTLSPDDDNPLPGGVSISPTARAGTGTITENDAATVSIAETAEAEEGSPVVFAVNLSAASMAPVTVRWTATTAGGDGAATLEGDRSDLTDDHALTGTVEFAADDTAAKTVSLATVNDDRVEGPETFTVTLSPDNDTPLPDGVTIPTATEAGTGTITEDDAAELSIADGSAGEGSPVVFEVSLSAAAMEGVTVRWTATTASGNGSATLEGAGSDLAAGEDLTGTVVFGPDDNAVKTVSIATIDDALVEGPETFTVTLSPDTDTPLPDGVTIPSAGAAATGAITESETAVLSIAETATAAEGSPVTFAIDLSAASQYAVTVRWTATATGEGAATLSGSEADLVSGQDLTGTVEFGPTDNATKTVSFATVDDDRVEGDETFTVTLSEDSLGGNLLPGGVDISDTLDTGTGTITEDDAAELSITDGAATEGFPVVFEVSLSAASMAPVTVRWTATTAGGEGAATLEGSGSDLASGVDLTGTVEFRANENATKTVRLATVNDTRVEGEETFTVTLSPDTDRPLPDGVTIPSGGAAATGTITEDDAAELSITDGSAGEGSPVVFDVSLSAAAMAGVTVRWTATSSAPAAGAATLEGAGSDLVSGEDLTGTVVFGPNDNADKTVSLATVDDALVEGDETFTVTLSPDTDTPLPNGVTIPSAGAAATGTITEDETAELSIASSATAAEGSSMAFAIDLSTASANAVTVRWTATTAGGVGSATLSGAGSDLTDDHPVTGTVVFAPTDTASKTVSFATVDDDRVEGDETFTVTLSEDTLGGNLLPGGVDISDTSDAGTGTITEDDAAELSIKTAATAAEGTAVEFAVSLSAPSMVPVTVRWTLTATGDSPATLAGSTSDLGSGQATTGTVEFQANDTADKTISITTAGDDRVEGSETFTVTLSEDTEGGNLLPGGVEISDTLDAGTGTITEDDAAELSIADGSAEEGAPVVFEVGLSAAAMAGVTVRWTATSSAPAAGAATLEGAGSDLASGEDLTGTVVFGPNDNAVKTVSLATVDDALVEGDETFTVTLSPDTDTPLPNGVTIPSAGAAATGTITEDETAELSIASEATAAEGASMSFAIDLSTASANAVTVRWTATTAGGVGSATLSGAGSDLTDGHAVTGTVAFAANDTATKMVSFATVDDDRVEGDETFTVTLSEDTLGGNLLPGGVGISDTLDAGTGTITEDDAAELSIETAATAAEGEAVEFDVSLSAAAMVPVTVRWTLTATGDSAATLAGSTSDLGTGQATTGTVVFQANDTTDQTVSIATAGDDRVEGSETFTVTLSEDTIGGNPLPGGVEISDTLDAGTGTITENDAATVSIMNGAATEGFRVVFDVSLSAPAMEGVTVRWTATSAAPAAGAATLSGAGSDLVANEDLSGTVVFQANENAVKAVSFGTVNDTLVEGEETFTVTLSPDPASPLPDGVTLAAGGAAATGTIIETETAEVSIASEATAAEGSPVTFAIDLSAASQNAVTVRWTATSAGGVGSATLAGAGSDLAAGTDLTGTVEFAANDTASKTVSFATVDDDRVEGSETFTVTLSEDTLGGNLLPGGVDISDTLDAGTGTITEADAAEVSIETAATAAEGTAVEFDVSLSAAAMAPVTVRWTLTATGDSPATLDGATSDLGTGQATTGTVEFQANDTVETVSITTTDDVRVEGDETFTVTLSPDDATPLPGGVTISPTARAGTGTITEDDAAELSITDGSAGEGSPVVFDVSLSAAAMAGVTVRWTATTAAPAAGAATLEGDGSDLVSGEDLTGTVVFGPNDSAVKTVSLATVNDTLVEGDETFTVTLSPDTDTPLPNGVTIPSAGAAATGTITEDETAALSIASSATAAEGSSMAFAIDLSAASANAVTVRWTATTAGGVGSATLEGGGSDLTDNHAVTGTVEFAANDTASQTVSFATVDDDRVEGDETFTVTLSEDTLGGNPLPGGVDISDTSDAGTGTITEADAAQLSITDGSGAEGSPVVFEVSLSAASMVPVTVRWTATTAGGDGAATLEGDGSDLTDDHALTGTVEFSADDTSATVSLATVDDARVEGSETFTVTLSPDDDTPLPDGITIPSAGASATGTITEDDMATVSIIPEADTQTEGDPFAFEVRLSAPVNEAVNVTWTAVAGTAAVQNPNSDLAASQDITGTATFAAGTTTAVPVPINTVDDDVAEGDETFTVTLSGTLPDGVDYGTQTATATITDNDEAELSIETSATAAEGSAVEFDVNLSAASMAPVTVRWTLTATGESAATLEGAGSDLGTGQDTSGTVEFTANDTAARTVSITTTDDDRVEGSETFTVTLSPDDDNPLPGGVSISPTARAGTGTITEGDAAELSIANGAATEGFPVVFEVSLSAAAIAGVTVRWTATTTAPAAGAATLEGAGSDLASGVDLTGTVVFRADDNAVKTVRLATVDDALVEGDETFTVTLSPDTDTPLPDGVSIPSARAAATGTITEDETAVLSIATTATAAEGSPVAFAIDLSAASQNAVTVRWTATSAGGDGSATLSGAGSDLASGEDLTGTVEFAANDTASKTVRFATVDDTRVEGSETFTVTLSEDTIGGNLLPGGVDISDTLDAGTGTITEDDMAMVSIAPEADSQTEGGSFAFEVRLSAPVDDAVTVTWTAVAGTAAVQGPNSDLATNQDITGTATFVAGTTTAVAVPIATFDDDVAEGDENFTVTLSGTLPTGVDYGTQTATATITDNDMAELSIETAATAAEGSPVEFDVSLSAASMAPVTVRWTLTATGDSAATLEGAGSDLGTGQDTSGTVEFTANDTADKTVSITTADDARVEGSEIFTVTLSPDADNPLPDGVNISDTAGAGTGTITEDDAAELSISDGEATEGSPVEFKVNLSAASMAPVTVRWTATTAGGDGAATLSGADSDLTAGHVLTGTVLFSANDTVVKTVSLGTVDDDLVEGAETFTVTLSQDTQGGNLLPGGVSISPTARAGTGTITEAGQRDERATLSIGDGSAMEGLPVEFDVSLSAASAAPVTVRWTLTATGDSAATLEGANSDLGTSQDTSGTVEFTANDTVDKTVSITTTDDDRVEGTETFTVTLSPDADNPLPGGVSISPTARTGTGTITEDDAATVSIVPEAETQTEGDSFAFEVRLSAPVNEAVNVTWTAVAGTAAVQDPNSDLAASQDITGTASFAVGTTTAVAVPINTLDDDVAEGDETFTVTLTGTLPTGVDYGTQTATATITDNDMATVSIAPEADSQTEGNPFAFEVRLSQAVDETVNVTWTAVAGTAAVQDPNSDLAASQDITGTATFTVGTTTAVAVPIATFDDDVAEGSETFTVTLSGALPDGVEYGTQTATATITDNDQAELSIETSATAAEGSPVEFDVSLSAASMAPVTVRWTLTATGDSAATLEGAGLDLGTGQDTSGTVEFSANDTAAKTVSITTADDDRVEGSETFTVTLSPDDDNPLPDGVTIPTATEAGTGTITEDDAATVSIAPEADSQTEGNAFAFEVRLSAPVDEAVTVTWTAVAGTAAVQDPNSDLAASQDITGTASFAAGTTTAVAVSIATFDDDVAEGSETFTVTLSGALPDGVEYGTQTATATITDNDQAELSIETSATAAEGSAVEFDVSLSAASMAPVTVRWTLTATGDSAATLEGAGSDLGTGQDTSGTVEFTANDTVDKTVSITTTDDDRVEGTETFTVTLSPDDDNPLPGGVSISPTARTGTGTITEDDAATVSIVPEAETQTEGDSFAFEVRLSQAVDEPINVTWTAVPGTAAVQDPNSDLAASQDITGTATFAASTTTAVAIPINTLDDDVAEGEEAFTVTLTGTLPDGVEYGTRTATATITDNDRATVSITPEADTQTEGDSFAFEVRLSQAVDEAVNVTWTAVAGTAAVQDPNSDLANNQAITGTATFAPGTTTAVAVPIATLDDTRVEGEEAFTVTLTGTLPDTVDYGTRTATATITDNDRATVSIAPEADTQTEGNPFAFEVRLSQAVDEAVNVTWTAVAGTAAVQDPNSDLANNQAITGTATFAPGTTTAVAVPIATLDDTRVEGEEAFTVTLTGTLPDDVDYGTRTATATITDNDRVVPVTVNIADAVAVAENAGPAVFTVSLSQAVTSDVVLGLTYVAGSAGLDDLGSDRPTTVTIRNGDTSAMVEVPIINDTDVENTETFTVTIDITSDDPTGFEVSLDDATAMGTITDDDMAQEATVSLSPLSPSVAEGGTFTFTVALSAASSSPVTVRWTAASAIARVDGRNSDLANGQATTGTVTFQANSTAPQTFTIATRNDAVTEGPETFTVSIAADPDNALPPGVIVGDDDEARATITDAADATTLTLSPSSSSRAEGRTFSFTVTLNGSSSSPVTARWRARASGDNPARLEGRNSDLADGQAISGRLVTFPANSPPGSSRGIGIATRDDAVAEGDETFTVDILEDPARPLPTGVTIGTSNSSTATITDAADAATVSIAPADASVAEGDTFAFEVRLSAPVDEAVNVTWTAVAGTAAVQDPSSDLAANQAISGTANFTAGTTTAVAVPIATLDDDRVEGEEAFTVTLTGTLPGGVDYGTQTATATITDNDEAPPPPPEDDAMVRIRDMTFGEAEGTAVFTVTLSEAVTSPVVLDVTYAEGSAKVAADLGTSLPTTVMIAANTLDATIAVPIIDDDIVEGEETFTVSLSEPEATPLPDGVTIADGEATGTITDNDEAPPPDDAMVRIGDMTVGEAAGNATFTVRLDQAVNSPVVLAVTYTDGSATVADDLGIPLPSTVMIAANTTEATIAVPITDDDLVEGEESFKVTISEPRDTPLPEGVTIADGEATGTITDNDAASASITPTAAALEGEEIGFKVQLDNPVSVPMTLSWTAEGSGEHPATADDLALSGTVTMPAQATEAMLLVATTQDVLVEPDETFAVTLEAGGSALPPGMTISQTAYQGTGTILNDDEPLLAFIEDTQAEEGEVLRFKVKLDRPTPERFTLQWSTSDGTALAGEDYESVSNGAVVFAVGASTADLTVLSMEDQRIEEDEYFEVVLSTDNLRLGVEVEDGTAVGTIENDDVLSVLLEPRRTAAMSALRRHVSRFERLTSSAAHNRLNGRGHGDGFTLAENIGSGDMAKGFAFGDSRWSGWLNGTYAGFHGESDGRQADLYTGVDYLNARGNLVWGVLLGHESARLEAGEADYESDFLQWGAYGGVRLSERLIWDGAVSYGTATPHIRVDDIFADYDAQRFSIRTNLTGTFELLASGALTVSPQLGVLYARERLGSFFDSVGGIGPREVLELGRISAGPRFIWRLPQASELTFGARFQWDVLRDAEGRQRRLSGAMDLGGRFSLTSKINMGIFLEADGIGNEDEFATYGGRVEINSKF